MEGNIAGVNKPFQRFGRRRLVGVLLATASLAFAGASLPRAALAAPTRNSPPSKSGLLVIKTIGLPPGQNGSVVLEGSGLIPISARLPEKRTFRLVEEDYTLRPKPVAIGAGHRDVEAGAMAYPTKKRIQALVKAGERTVIAVNYSGVVNPSTRTLPRNVISISGDPKNPSALVLPARGKATPRGTIFVSGPTARLPYGLISEVTRTERRGHHNLVRLKAVPVTDAVPSLSFTGNLELKPIPAGASSERPKPTATASSACKPPKLVKFGAHLDNVELRQASIGTFPPQMNLTLAVRTTASMGVAAAAAGVNCDWTLAEIGPYQGAIPVGPIVVPVYATVPVKAGIHVNGRLEVGTVHVASTTVARAAAGFDENRVSLSQQGSNVWLSGAPAITGSAKLSAAIGVQAGIGVAKGANVHLEADFGPEFDWHAGGPCELYLNLGALSAGVTVLGKSLTTPSFAPLKPRLWSGCPPHHAGGSEGGGGTAGGGGEGAATGPPGTHFGPVTVYPLPSGYRLTYDVTTDQEGNIWFGTLEGGDGPGGGAIGKVAKDGSVTAYPLPHPDGQVWHVATGPEGHIWFADPATSSLGEATPDGQVGEYSLSGYGNAVPTGVSGGPDGNVWFTTGNGVSKRRPNGEITDYEFPPGWCGSSGIPIIDGPEGSLWIGACERIGKVTTGGSISGIEMEGGRDIYDIAASPDNHLWVTAATPNAPLPGLCWIGRVSTGGAQQWFELPSGTCGSSLTVGPEGDIWFVQVDSQSIDRLHPATGAITRYSYPPGWGLYIGGLTVGPDGAIWGGSYSAVVRIEP